MKRKLLTLLMLILGATQSFAAPVDQAAAQQAAASFAQTALAMETRSNDLQMVMATENYYVFNVGTSGFVIISSDDCFRPVVAYSYEGTFSTEDPSPEMMYYLDNLSEGRKALRARVTPDASVTREWKSLLAGEKMPARNGQKGSFYIVQTKWNQNSPYNKFAPSNSYAGCVATAMSQVMAFWKYPTHGWGSHSYTHYQYGVISADFSTAVYDFDLMPRSLDMMSPTEQIDAVAGFMYHCGVAVDMDYSPSGSGAYSQDVPDAVLRYFGYSNRCRLHNRDSYSLKDFQRLLKDQFDLGWPCYYSGTDTEGQGGHAFVCDGYDDNDMFHFNWGWGGSGDGFFAIDELNVSGYQFNSGQAVITNYVPAEVFENTVKAPEFFMAVPNGDDQFSVTLSWTNPTATLDGHDIDAIDQIVLLRDGQEVQTFDNPEPGATMSYVDVTGLPIMVDYSVYAVINGNGGRKARVDDVNLGPTCPWTVTMSSSSAMGWGGGVLTILNASGLEAAVLTAERSEAVQTIDVPQGRLTLRWNAPEEDREIGMEITDAEDQTVFSYNGLASMMPQGIFFEMVNTCGSTELIEHPSNLNAFVLGDDIVLNWQGIRDPGYGYMIYRDGYFYSMVVDTALFYDRGEAAIGHSYFVTAFCVEGETEPSNTVCAMKETPEKAPRNLDFEVLEDGKIKLSWEQPEMTEGHEGYILYRKAQGETYKRVKPLGANATTYTDKTALPDGNRYFYKLVSMHNDGKAAAESSPAHALRNPDLLYVMVNDTHIPSALSLEEQNGELLLQWEPALLAESYNLYCNGVLVAEGLTEPACTDTLRGDALMYQVTGVHNGVESSPSNKAYYGSYDVQETEIASPAVFPNPTNGIVNIVAENLREVSVYNLTGQQVLHRKTDGRNSNIDLSQLGSGVFYLSITTGNAHFMQKVIVVK